jgi:hypothetical protein
VNDIAGSPAPVGPSNLAEMMPGGTGQLCEDIRFLAAAFFKVANVVDLYDFVLDPSMPPLSHGERLEALSSARRLLHPEDLAEAVQSTADRVLADLDPLETETGHTEAVRDRPFDLRPSVTGLNRVIETVLEQAQLRSRQLLVEFFPGQLPPVEATREAGDALRVILDQLARSGEGIAGRVRVATWAAAGTSTLIVSSDAKIAAQPVAPEIVAGLSEQLGRAGASLRIHSGTDGGCTFLIRLPTQSAPAVTAGHPDHRPRPLFRSGPELRSVPPLEASLALVPAPRLPRQ